MPNALLTEPPPEDYAVFALPDEPSSSRRTIAGLAQSVRAFGADQPVRGGICKIAREDLKLETVWVPGDK
jgi:hypothetical protein